ncbi:MAG: hypothetical protein LLG00_13130 [Planctomycetaceae bacterium]|nr:hypothetical protein [Planctomycetaceae bacterium]
MGMLNFVMVLSFLASESAGNVPSKVHKDAGVYYLGDCKPPAIKGWRSIPEPARSQIVTHLKKRLGDRFFAKLSLTGGQVIDLKALRDKEPNSKNYRWEVPTYVLHLRFALPERGIEYYDAQIDCRADGSIVNEVDLPEIAKYPERSQFISVSTALETAKKNGFDPTKTETELGYRPKLGVCVFSFSQVTEKATQGIEHLRCLDINAHNGKVIESYTAPRFVD